MSSGELTAIVIIVLIISLSICSMVDSAFRTEIDLASINKESGETNE